METNVHTGDRGHAPRRRDAGGRTERLIRTQLGLRLALVTLAILAMWIVDAEDVRTQLVLTAGIAFVYAPAATLVHHRRRVRDNRGLQLAGAGLDIAFGLGGVLLLPAMRTAVLFLYLMLIANESISVGRRRGLGVALVTVVAATLVDLWLGLDSTREALGLLQFGGSALALPILIDTLSQEHRRTAEHLARLHRALASLAATSDLEGTFETIAATAERAVGASFVAVMTFNDEEQRTLTAASITATGIGALDRIPSSIDVASEVAPRSPSELAVRSGEPVVVSDFDHDARFGGWSRTARRQGIAAMVAVPLRTGPTTVGTLNAYFETPVAISDADVDLLVAYAEGAALSILRAQAYERERAAAVALRDAERIKSEFTAAITHELRTPLTTVRGFVETLLLHDDQLSPEERKRMLEVSRRNAIDLSYRISSLLEFSKLETDHVIVEPHPQLLAPAVATAIDNCSGLLIDHEVEVDLPDDVMVDLDELALEHVISNLVSNAVKYAPEGSTVEIHAQADDRDVTITVRDHGMGIPPDEAPRVFERFYRGADRGHGRRGTGIGLAIVQRYVELGRGRIWVDSEVGVGTAFSFTVPLAGVTGPDRATADVVAFEEGPAPSTHRRRWAKGENGESIGHVLDTRYEHDETSATPLPSRR